MYTIIEGIISPINSVSAHVIDLQSMNIGRKGSDFYATMLLRDFFLWLWRCAGGILFLFIIRTVGAQREILADGLYFMAFSFILTYLGAFLMLQKIQAVSLPKKD